MIYNYHVHTFRCHHASETEEEYVRRAIENGIRFMGFSDHFPFRFPDGFESKFRVSTCEAGDYCSEVLRLKEKYKNDIDIKLGFEMEYYPIYFDNMLKKAIEYGAEYLILGQHFIENEHPDGFYVQDGSDSEDDLKEYVRTVISGMGKKVFSYVAHPDVFKYTGDKETFKREMKKICVASREMNIPLEINFLGIRKGRNYPDPLFWEMAGQVQSPVVFGFDSHSLGSAYDGNSLQVAKETVKKYNLNYIGKPELVSLADVNCR